MNSQPQSRCTFAAIILQSVFLFLITFLLSATPHLWNDTYATLLEGQLLPAITQLILEITPASGMGMFCLATMVSLTHLCVGIMLLATSKTKLIATQRALFLSSATWGCVILITMLAFVAQALPFATIILVLPADEEIRTMVAQNRVWSIWTTIYGMALITITVLVCRKCRKNELTGL